MGSLGCWRGMAEPERKIPWPRVGQSVRLKSGVVGEVVTILRGVDALRSKNEMEILMLGPSMQIAVGANWMNLYYEATIQLHDYALMIVTPREVIEAFD